MKLDTKETISIKLFSKLRLIAPETLFWFIANKRRPCLRCSISTGAVRWSFQVGTIKYKHYLSCVCSQLLQMILTPVCLVHPRSPVNHFWRQLLRQAQCDSPGSRLVHSHSLLCFVWPACALQASPLLHPLCPSRSVNVTLEKYF